MKIKDNIHKKNDIENLIMEKIRFYKDIINKTIKNMDYYKYLDIITQTEYNNCIFNLEIIFNKCSSLKQSINHGDKNDTTSVDTVNNYIKGDKCIENEILQQDETIGTNILTNTIISSNNGKHDNTNFNTNDNAKDNEDKKHTKDNIDWSDTYIRGLQEINDGLYSIFKSYGTDNITDLLCVVFGKKYINNLLNNERLQVIKTFFKPIGFKIIDNVKQDKNNKSNNKKDNTVKNKIINDNSIAIRGKTLECYDIGRNSNNFNIKLNGIKILFQYPEENKCIIVNGVMENIIITLCNNNYIVNLFRELKNGIPDDQIFKSSDFTNFTYCVSLRDILVYSKEELYNRFNGYINQVNLMKQQPVTQIVREFINDTLYIQRCKLIQLLIKGDSSEHQYLCYLLYDLLTNDDKGLTDSKDQQKIYDSLPWEFKKLFKTAMKTTNDYTNKLRNTKCGEVKFEQQICLMNVSDNVKEKAMIKLKEVKAKNEDSGLKARQYLEGLLKIPFGIYRCEPILLLMKENNILFKNIINDIYLNLKNNNQIGYFKDILKINEKTKFTPMEIYKYKNYIKNEYLNTVKDKEINKIVELLTQGKRDDLVKNIILINNLIKTLNININKLIHSGKKINYLKNEITKFINKYKYDNIILSKIQDTILLNYSNEDINNNTHKLTLQVQTIDKQWESINNNMKNIRTILNNAVHGHTKAKRQIERIIGQWMTGTLSGYCFGFEGPPGVGKTSLAKKGLAKCLIDDKGNSRPFGFIAVGGSSNASTLDGHNYTYVGSSWGRIVDILIESKCMNPIIFIDELDKISKTENGKEIIGILTHLVDPTQNDGFQDKYFNGIDIDLSKALFVFSYNDPSLLDKILLDRIHRIKFNSQSTEQKVVITRDYILPEIYEKVNMIGMIDIKDDAIKYIIENFTYESGVRKLKQVLFEIISEINLEILNNTFDVENIPHIIDIDNIKNKYLKHRDEIPVKKIHNEPQTGIINGLWANALGQGGIIPIQCNLYPSSTFLELNLTGMQGDVMKESMNVAKSLAYKLTPSKNQEQLIKEFKKSHLQGIHIHCPEGATPKDGPSAGTAITCCIYSLFNSLKINNTFGITGEIDLQGNVTEIGGLDLKIIGGIRAGIKSFIYPKKNKNDFDKFWKKYSNNVLVDGITFYPVERIEEVFELIFVK